MKSSLTDEQIADHVRRIDEIGYTILEGVVPRDMIAKMADAFVPVYESNLGAIRDEPNRGPMRHYIVLPFEPPHYQSAFHGHADIFAIVRAILGPDAYCTQFATDTPAKGSVHQKWHADCAVHRHADGRLKAPDLIVANTSYVDVTPENGPFEVSDGSHHDPDAIDRLTAGELDFTPLFLKVGDVLVRDPRCIHRGSPNTTYVPRVVAVLGFDREGTERGVHRTENGIHPAFYDSLCEDEQMMYRKVPRLASDGQRARLNLNSGDNVAASAV